MRNIFIFALFTTAIASSIIFTLDSISLVDAFREGGKHPSFSKSQKPSGMRSERPTRQFTKSPGRSNHTHPTGSFTRRPTTIRTRNPSIKGSEGGLEKCKDIIQSFCTNCTVIEDNKEKMKCFRECVADFHDEIEDEGCKLPEILNQDCINLTQTLCNNCASLTSFGERMGCMKTCVKDNKEEFEKAGCKRPGGFDKDHDDEKEEEEEEDDDDDEEDEEEEDDDEKGKGDKKPCKDLIMSLCKGCMDSSNKGECFKACIDANKDTIKDSSCKN